MEIKKALFGVLDEQNIYSYTLRNQNGMEVTCIDYGCIITNIIVPDAKGILENVVLGFNSLEDYQNYSPYFGAVCGRVAGRIALGKFELKDKVYQLTKNNGNNHLHGGHMGFDKVVWNSLPHKTKNSISVVFNRMSVNGEEGYPGNLDLRVTYTLTNDNVFTITYEGETDETTLVNLTNHSYFNLSGNAKSDILNHNLYIKSDQFLELDSGLIPTGTNLEVENTPFDFRSGKKILVGTNSNHPQNMLAGEGFDHPFLLNCTNNREIILEDEASGRRLVIETDQPCVVLYTGTQLNNDFKIGDVQSRKYLGLCLETQGIPDAINQRRFPTVVLNKGEYYRSTTKYSFEIITNN